jgi:DNA-binding NarL/FixJ family response regulator
MSQTPIPIDLSSESRQGHLEAIFGTFCTRRALSVQQQRVLDLYLKGKCDKEIAEICRCAEATIHEHWRRMARKVGGTLKSDVIGDFHRFLGGG